MNDWNGSDTPDDLIEHYLGASAEERYRIEQRILGDPSSSEKLRADLDLARSLVDERPEDSVDDEALAWYVVTKAVSPHPFPESLREKARRIEGELRRSPELRQRAEEIGARTKQMEGASDAAAHFEALTGHKLPQTKVTRVTIRPGRAPAERRGFRRSHRFKVAGLSLIVCACLVVLADRVSGTGATRMLHNEAESMPSLTMRSGPGFTASPQALFYDAIVDIRRSRSTTFGLFPRYDKAALQEAENKLSAVLSSAPDDPWLIDQAAFFLATVSVVQGKEAESCALLDVLQGGGGSRSDQAETLFEMSCATGG